jgi:hypothetical protein
MDYSKFIWEVRRVEDMSAEADGLKARLAEEVEKILDAGHLAPMRCMYGEIEPHFMQWQPGEVVYALALAYPYLPEELCERVVDYVRRELAEYPPWSVRFLPVNRGTFIEWHARNISNELRLSDWARWWGMYAQRYHNLHALYGLWLYAERAGDWKAVEGNYSKIAFMFQRDRRSITQYMDTSGAIGFARIARRMGDTKRAEEAVKAITEAMQAGRDFGRFAENTRNANGSMGGRGTAQVFQYICPEVARYLAETNRPAAQAHLDALRARYLLWFLAMPPHSSGQFGEGVGTAPDIRNGIMTAAALVEGAAAPQLQKWLDLPWTPLGDLYHLQHLVWTIEAYGKATWQRLDRTPAKDTL